MTPKNWPVIWIALTASSAVAAEPNCLENDPEDCRATVVVGEVAPFSGQLLSPARAARLAVAAGQCDERKQIAVREATEMLQLDLALEKRLRSQDLAAAELKTKLLTQEVTRLQSEVSGPFWREPALWFALGVAASVGVVAGAVATLNATR